jgi:hypothetical protein
MTKNGKKLLFCNKMINLDVLCCVYIITPIIISGTKQPISVETEKKPASLCPRFLIEIYIYYKKWSIESFRKKDSDIRAISYPAFSHKKLGMGNE